MSVVEARNQPCVLCRTPKPQVYALLSSNFTLWQYSNGWTAVCAIVLQLYAVRAAQAPRDIAQSSPCFQLGNALQLIACCCCCSGKDFKELALEIFDVLPDGEVSLEVVSITADEMVREARTLLTWAPKVGLHAMASLKLYQQ